MRTVLRRQEAVLLRELTSIGLHPTSSLGGAQGDLTGRGFGALAEGRNRPTKTK